MEQFNDPLEKLLQKPDTNDGVASSSALPQEAKRPGAIRGRTQSRPSSVTAADVSTSAEAQNHELNLVPTSRESDFSASENDDRSEDPLSALAPLVERARVFSDRWDAAYRADVFRAAIEVLRADAGLINPPAGQKSSAHAAARIRLQGAPNLGEPLEKVARTLAVSVDDLSRNLSVTEDGRVTILARFDGKTKKELQTSYSLVLLYVKEIGVGTRMVDIEDLRTLCIEQGCYDQSNFTANFKKDVDGGLLREQGEKGARSRRYLLSQKGLLAAADLIRKMIEQ